MASPYQQAISVALSDAKSMLGKNEAPNRSEIMQYLHDGGQDLDPHKLAWCAAFVSASLQKAGLPVPTQVVKDSAFGPGAYAPNYLTYGSAVEPKNIQAGDVLVANNGSHVGFAEGPIRQGPNGPEVQLLAGNERDPSGQYAPGSYTNPQTGAVANRAQVGMVGERWVPLSQYNARRYEPTDGSSTATAPAAQAPQGEPSNSNVIDTLSRNIAGIESGGWKNPYEALGPNVPGRGQAIGKYQVMPENVPGWTLAATGHSMTPDQFRADPAAQEAVFRNQMQRSLQLYSPKDAASIWFTGKPFNVAGGAASDKYTTNADYVARATAGLDDSGTFKPGAAVAATPGTTLTSIPAGGQSGVLPGFGTKQASDDFLAGLKKAGITPDTGQGGDQQPDMRPAPIMSGPGLRNASSPGSIEMQARELEPQLTGYSPTPYGQSLNSQPLAWASSPIGAPAWLKAAGPQQPQGYGTSLNSLQTAYGLLPQQMQMLMNPMMLNQGGGYG
ncbi:MAG TPA: hypothetical protein VFW22_07895 [Pseudolabrys sp.]|nr:hypothetical protein [Pseudolabrys sp.]